MKKPRRSAERLEEWQVEWLEAEILEQKREQWLEKQLPELFVR